MKRILVITILLSVSLIVAHLATAYADDAAVASITVNMSGFKSDLGKARVALVNNKISFDSESVAPYKGAIVDIKNGSSSHTFKAIPYGEYAVKFFHDVDGSGTLKTGAFGIPKEEYGFSNNISSKNYNKAKFQVNSSSVTLNISAK